MCVGRTLKQDPCGLGEKGNGSLLLLCETGSQLLLLESSKESKVVICSMTNINSGVIDPETSLLSVETVAEAEF